MPADGFLIGLKATILLYGATVLVAARFGMRL